MGENLVVVDPAALPSLRGVFADALSVVDRQIALADAELRVTPWAEDPVSVRASAMLNERSVDSDRSMLDALRAYQRQLRTAVDLIDQTAHQYQVSDEDNSVTVGERGTTG